MKLTAPSIRTWDPPETRAVLAEAAAAATDAYAKRIGLLK